MSTGLLALLDDVAGLAKMAAASLDDAVAQSSAAGAKAAGVVVDDAAMAPGFVDGFKPEREIPIVARIAAGSLRNKLLILMPAAMALGWLAPWAITPLLMAGGVYLAFEGAEKLLEELSPRAVHAIEDDESPAWTDAKSAEDAKVSGAIKTDFILSSEIMAITLGSVAGSPPWIQAFVLAAVGTGITFLVYGVVAVIVKIDDLGLALARVENPASAFLSRVGVVDKGTLGSFACDRRLRPVCAALGRALVKGMPKALEAMAAVGTAAMLWVGGGILLHGAGKLGLEAPVLLVEGWAHAAESVAPAAGLSGWLVESAAAALVGTAVGVTAMTLLGAVRRIARR